MTSRCRATLTELANRFGSDKGDLIGDKHDYAALYELLLGPFRDAPIAVLQIGLASEEPAGGKSGRAVDNPSVAMWLEYFSKADIIGFDISDVSHFAHERFTFVRGDAGSRSDLDRLSTVVPAFDVIIDDGSHASFHQQSCLKHLWAKLRPGGLYIIEDLHWQSPIYEASLPQVPKTADLFLDAFEREILTTSTVFTEADLLELRAGVQSHALFRDHAGRSAAPKLLVLRKSWTSDSASHQQKPASTGDTVKLLPRVRSFDLFDTLVARRCVWPKSIFELIEQRLQITGFTSSRAAAEGSIAQDDYCLDDIYHRLLIDRPDLAGEVQQAKELELALELEHLFPIEENLAQVSPGDIIVSDMYLPREIVERIVFENAGLRNVTVFVTPHGKRCGTVWPLIQNQFNVMEHLGDNLDTDLRSPSAVGIPARRTTAFEPTSLERDMMTGGLPRLGEAVRESRLATWTPDPDERQLQLLQAGVNAPMLLIATILVLRAARQAGVSTILASGRDCYLWLQMLQSLQERYAPGVTSTYFYTSRICRSFPSDTYLDYVRRLVGEEQAFILDICGTGWSLQRLCERLGLTNAQPLLIQRLTDPSLRARYESWGATAGTSPMLSLLDPRLNLNNELVELANPAPHPTVVDVVPDGTVDRPIYLECPTGHRTIRQRSVLVEAFEQASRRLLTGPVLDELAMAPSDVLSDRLASLYASYANFAGVLLKMTPEHRVEDQAVCALLRDLGQARLPRVA